MKLKVCAKELESIMKAGETTAAPMAKMNNERKRAGSPCATTNLSLNFPE
jgi:hypothetical protein